MDYFCGCIGGFFGTIISHPIDTVKTRVQSDMSLTNALKMKQYFSGIKWPIILVPVEKAIVFGVSSYSKSHGLGSAESGFIAGFASTLIVTPMEYLKINIQNGSQLNLRSLSVKQAYKGIGPTICRESPGYAVYIATYDNLTSRFNKEKNLWKSFLFGGITGLTSWLVIYPTDLIKTKVQDKNNTKSVSQIIKSVWNSPVDKKFTYLSTNTKQLLFPFLKSLNFYEGLLWALGRSIPLHAGVFVGYEISKKYCL